MTPDRLHRAASLLRERPDAALLLADWLDTEADRVADLERRADLRHDAYTVLPYSRPALALADLILGGAQ